jgi:hypothetical protein
MHAAIIGLLTAFTTSPICLPAASAHVPATGALTTRARPAAETLRELWDAGVAWPAFLEATKSRRELWLSNWASAIVPEDVLGRAKAAGSGWKLLIIAIDTCSDSVSTVPWIAKLVESLPGLELRIVDPTRGRPVMESHRTSDGRAATPTLVLLNSDWQDAGCWIERPAVLEKWYQEHGKALSSRDYLAQKLDWYARDAGRETLREVVDVIETAARGGRLCPAALSAGSPPAA